MSSEEPARVLLVTGSRMYPAMRINVVQQVLERELRNVPRVDRHRYVLRHGDGIPNKDDNGVVISGLDFLAALTWARLGGTCDPMPANWRRFAKRAGPIRNGRMVVKEPIPYKCLGFPWFEGGARSSGTIDCMSQANAAQIPTYRIRANGSEERYTGDRSFAIPVMSRVRQRVTGADDLPSL